MFLSIEINFRLNPEDSISGNKFANKYARGKMRYGAARPEAVK